MLKVVHVVGARPNLMKIAPIMSAMARRGGFEQALIHTGQHYDEAMSQVFFRDLGIAEPDFNLGVGSGSHSAQTAQVMLALEPILLDRQPDCVIVVGDVNSTLAATLVAAKLLIPVAHVEAGLRSFDDTMPEELNRRLTDAASNFLFTTSPEAGENLRREGIDEGRVHFVGNVMIDTLLRWLPRARLLGIPKSLGLASHGYAVVTLHRPSNVDAADGLERVLDSLEQIQDRLPVVLPLHPRTRERLVRFGLSGRLQRMSHLRVMEPLGYLEFLGLLADARLVLTDSGGIQEETTILGVPCLTLRDNTERPVTITRGTNRLVGTRPERIVEAARQVLGGAVEKSAAPELWDGHAAERIVEVLARRLGVRG